MRCSVITAEAAKASAQRVALVKPPLATDSIAVASCLSTSG